MKPTFQPIFPAEKNALLVHIIQGQLLRHGFSNVPQDGIYDRHTLAAVRAFQSIHTDALGHPLLVDGIIGQNTWFALFGKHPHPEPHTIPVMPDVTIPLNRPSSSQPSPLQRLALQIAGFEVGILEAPLRSNLGPRVQQYHKSVGVRPGAPWCAAFIYWCFQQAANELCTLNPLPKTAHCLTHWNKSQGHRIPAGIIASPSSNEVGQERGALIKPGTIFIINHGSGRGHTGIVVSPPKWNSECSKYTIETIEGNTNQHRSSEGIGVFRHIRNLSEINTGFINYG
ncbi:putative peptidoglycan binding protein [Breznakibacter xylanolyticus]|uniref:Putative peptidoglycan binding protein n=1 Tax=Breznakibacter xylanolyticus TaxID=990 RepID=A0A2W7NI37_9BACT|nr:peptidoglycan-binding domain-containing protein [Breznakibacter xylanolyticus]PZX20101.1 putative peptidoglycan binding protein [Breznakibacter xylanolyticus]